MAEEYAVREAGEADFPAITDFLQQHDFGPRKPEWMRWKYLENPYGCARIFISEDSRQVVHALLGFEPRLYRLQDAEPVTIMQAVDGIVAPEMRGKGLYPRLLKTAMMALDAPMLGFPNKRGEISHLRSGWSILAPELRYYFPVEIGVRFSQTSIGFLAPLLNLLSKGYASIWLGRKKTDLHMEAAEKFEKDFFPESTCLRGLRTAEFLNWRFIDNPMTKCYVHRYFEEGESIGYSAYSLDGSSAEVLDFFTIGRARSCLRLFVDHCREKELTHILFRGIGIKFGKFGFVRRPSGTNYIGHRFPRGPYMITLGDSDW